MIRLATIEDTHAIANIHVTSWRETYASIVPSSYLDKLDIAERQRLWTTALERGQSVYVAEVGGQIVGFANAGGNRDKESPYPGELYAIYMLKNFHKRGMGKQLFASVASYLSSNHLLPFITYVLADNPTLGFYLHMGAKIIGEHLKDFDGCALKELQLAWE